MGHLNEKDLLSLLKRALEIYKKNSQLVKNILKHYKDLNHPYKTTGLLHSTGLTVGGFPWIAALPMIFAGLYYLMSSGTEIYRTIKEKKFQDEKNRLGIMKQKKKLM